MRTVTSLPDGMSDRHPLVLGLHKDPWHDTGAAAVTLREDGTRIIAHINEERLDRRKSSRAFPALATAACLRELGAVSPADADLVAIDWSMNSTGWDRDYRRNPCRTDVFLRDLPPRRIVQVRHHLCHAAASFYTSPYERAAVLVVDGRGSNYETQTLWIGNGRKLQLVAETSTVGVGLLYEAITRLVGFGPLQAGKTMGLAPFGSGATSVPVDLSGRFDGISTDYGHLCGRDDEILFKLEHTLDERHRALLAWEVQQECERAMLHLSNWARRETGEHRLCLGGGVALNGVANHKIWRSGLFDDIFVNPACSDSGIALGAALWGLHEHLGHDRVREEVPVYTGPSYSAEAFEVALASLGPMDRFFISRQKVLHRTASVLARGHCVAIFQGRSEMGPRALGNRSILMSPFNTEARDRLNHVVKRRESFRPFAPVVRLEEAERYFELGIPSPYMLNVCPVRERFRTRLAAVTHVDGTARPQTLAPGQNDRLRKLLGLFGDTTGIPVLLNTSFNVADEPLVESPLDAVRCFLSADIDALLLQDVLIEKLGRRTT